MDSISDLSLPDYSRSRTRTKSEAIQDLSGASIKQFVEQILFKEFKVFEHDEAPTEKKKTISDDDINENLNDSAGKLDEISGKGAAD
jgi:hypothetical protein